MSNAPQQIILPRTVGRDGQIERVARVLRGLPMDDAWRVEIHRHKPTRSSEQNRYLWAIYAYILTVGGEEMRGWTKEELHEFFLGEHFGWQEKRIFGRRKMVPARRSSRLAKMEFVDFVDSIASFMASQGVYVPTPNDDWEQVIAQQRAA
jgi:hypothetical protein